DCSRSQSRARGELPLAIAARACEQPEGDRRDADRDRPVGLDEPEDMAEPRVVHRERVHGVVGAPIHASRIRMGPDVRLRIHPGAFDRGPSPFVYPPLTTTRTCWRPVTATKEQDVGGPEIAFLNRELSQLDLIQRVFELSSDPAEPLLERVKFCGIVASILDEFFMVRV